MVPATIFMSDTDTTTDISSLLPITDFAFILKPISICPLIRLEVVVVVVVLMMIMMSLCYGSTIPLIDKAFVRPIQILIQIFNSQNVLLCLIYGRGPVLFTPSLPIKYNIRENV